MTLNHVHLGTKDLEKFISFYQTYFGFRKKFEHGQGAFLEDQKGFLIAVDPVEILPDWPSWYHLGFCLESEEQVLEMYRRMKLGSVQIVRDLLREENEFASFFIKDPDGNKLEISWLRD